MQTKTVGLVLQPRLAVGFYKSTYYTGDTALLNAVIAEIEKQGAEALVMSVGEFEKYLNQDIAKWAHVVKVSGAKPE